MGRWLVFLQRPRTCSLTFADGTNAVILRFDPEYSPPDAIKRAGRPDLNAAYNRAAFSHSFKKVKVFIEDSSGTRYTTGANSELILTLKSFPAYYEPSVLAAQTAESQATWAALDYHPFPITTAETSDAGLAKMATRNVYRTLLGASTPPCVRSSSPPPPASRPVHPPARLSCLVLHPFSFWGW